jgi:hypothetical protein
MQVWWSKIIVVYTLVNYNFGEFLRFFPGGLNPFKIQSKFTSQKRVEFFVQILFQIGVGPMDKVVHLRLILQNWISHNFWRPGSSLFYFWIQFGKIKSKTEIRLGPLVSQPLRPLVRSHAARPRSPLPCLSHYHEQCATVPLSLQGVHPPAFQNSIVTNKSDPSDPIEFHKIQQNSV